MKDDNKAVDEPRVRGALRLDVDDEAVTRLALRGFGEEAEHHLVAPVHPGYAPLPAMGYRPEEARALLAEAGHPEGIDITITCKNWPKWELDDVKAMAAQYAEPGIRCPLAALPAARFWEVGDEVPLAVVEWSARPLGSMRTALTPRSGR